MIINFIDPSVTNHSGKKNSVLSISRCGLMLLLRFSSHTDWVLVHWLHWAVTINSQTTFTSMNQFINSWSAFHCKNIEWNYFDFSFFLKRCIDRVYGELEHKYVCWICNILGCGLHGAWTTETGGWSGSIWSGSSIFGLSIGSVTTAWRSAVGLLVLLHVTVNRSGFAILYNGRFYYGCYWWVAQIASSP